MALWSLALNSSATNHVIYGWFYICLVTAHSNHNHNIDHNNNNNIHNGDRLRYIFLFFDYTLLHHPQLTLYTSEDPAEPRSTKTAQTMQNVSFGPFSKFYFILFVTNLFYIVYIGYNVQWSRHSIRNHTILSMIISAYHILA